MAYIYKIINDINNKIYIGKTEFSIEKRFKEHCEDYKKKRNEKRPLYNAMNKYGIEHFHIYEIEQTDNPEEREKYWIEHYGSFKNGYNATLGGDGTKYIDYDLVVATYNELHSIRAVANILNIDAGHIATILKEKNIKILSTKEILRNRVHIINQYDLNDTYIQSFPSAHEAAKAVVKNYDYTSGAHSHITNCCKGKQKTAYGYKWKYGDC